MSRANQETITTFGEVMHSANIAYSQNRSTVANDNRLMIYFQGMKIYIPEEFQADTLLKLLQTLKEARMKSAISRKQLFQCRHCPILFPPRPWLHR